MRQKRTVQPGCVISLVKRKFRQPHQKIPAADKRPAEASVVFEKTKP